MDAAEVEIEPLWVGKLGMWIGLANEGEGEQRDMSVARVTVWNLADARTGED